MGHRFGEVSPPCVFISGITVYGKPHTAINIKNLKLMGRQQEVSHARPSAKTQL